MAQAENILQTSFDTGYSVAGVVLDFVNYVDEKAQYPIKVCLRDGEIFMHGAKKLSQLAKSRFTSGEFQKDEIDFVNRLEKWDDFFLTREFVENLPLHVDRNNNKTFEYLDDKGVINKDITVVDTGYRGRISIFLHAYNSFRDKSAYNPFRKEIQSIFLNGAPNVLTPNNIMSKDLKNKVPKGIDWLVFDAFPKQYEPIFLEYEGKNGFSPEPVIGFEKDLHTAFVEGLVSGLEVLTKNGKNFNVDGGMPREYYKFYENNFFKSQDFGNEYTDAVGKLFGCPYDDVSGFNCETDETIKNVNAEIKDIYKNL